MYLKSSFFFTFETWKHQLITLHDVYYANTRKDFKNPINYHQNTQKNTDDISQKLINLRIGNRS